jgi:hypothetical protein
LLDLDEVLLQRVNRDLLILRLRLEQDDRAYVVGLAFRRHFQRRPLRNRVAHRILPGTVLGEHDRQLDHLGGFKLLGRHAVQDIGVRSWRRCELDNRAWIRASLHLAREACHGIVRLVHDHQRSMDVQQVGEGKFRPAPVELFQTGRQALQRAEMRLHVLIMRIDLAAFRVRHPQGLNRADDDAGVVANVMRTDDRKIRDVEDAHASIEHLVQRPAVRVPRVLQRLDRLQPDRVRRHEPEDKRMILLDPGVARDADRMRAEDGLAAAGW